MPLLLEAALYCDKFHLSPSVMGYDEHDPRVLRAFSLALSLHSLASQRLAVKNRPAWNKQFPEAAALLRSARRGMPAVDEGEVAVELPTRKR